MLVTNWECIQISLIACRCSMKKVAKMLVSVYYNWLNAGLMSHREAWNTWAETALNWSIYSLYITGRNIPGLFFFPSWLSLVQSGSFFQGKRQGRVNKSWAGRVGCTTASFTQGNSKRLGMLWHGARKKAQSCGKGWLACLIWMG